MSDIVPICPTHDIFFECPECNNLHIAELEAKLADAEQEIFDHAKWAEAIMKDPNSKPLRDLQSKLADVRALPRHSIHTGGMVRVPSGQWVNIEDIKEALNGDKP